MGFQQMTGHGKASGLFWAEGLEWNEANKPENREETKIQQINTEINETKTNNL